MTPKLGQKVNIVHLPQFEGQTGQIILIIPNVTTGGTQYLVELNNGDELVLDARYLRPRTDLPLIYIEDDFNFPHTPYHLQLKS